MTPFLTLVIPAYNEGPRLISAVRSAERYFSGRPYRWEILVVDDGSRDDTVKRLQEEFKTEPKVRWIRHPVNRGKGAAIRTGLEQARGDNILFCDADGATPLNQIEKMLPYLSGKPALIAASRTLTDSRVQVRQALLRRSLSRGYRWLCRSLVTPGISDITCGFKLIPRSSIGLLVPRMRVPGWSFDAEIFAILQAHRLPIVQVPVDWADQGKSKVRLRRDVFGSLAELASIGVRRWTGGYR